MSGAWNPSSASNIATDEHGDFLALHALLERATKITSTCYVTHANVAQAATNAVLVAAEATSIRTADGRGKSLVETVGRIVLDATEQDRTVTDDFLAIQRDEQARIARHDMRLRALMSLFTEPGMARLWWAERNPELLIALKDGSFEKVLDHMPQRLIDKPGTHADIIIRFVNSLDEDGKQLALRVFESVLDKWNAPDLLADLRRLQGEAEDGP